MSEHKILNCKHRWVRVFTITSEGVINYEYCGRCNITKIELLERNLENNQDMIQSLLEEIETKNIIIKEQEKVINKKELKLKEHREMNKTLIKAFTLTGQRGVDYIRKKLYEYTSESIIMHEDN